MSVSDQEPGVDQGRVAQFNTTHWSVVLAAGHSSAPGATEALEKLCHAYWYPLYAYLRRSGRDTHDAQDLTQAFFARLIEKKDFALADREKGKFRFYLLGALKHFLADQHDKATHSNEAGVKRSFPSTRRRPNSAITSSRWTKPRRTSSSSVAGRSHCSIKRWPDSARNAPPPASYSKTPVTSTSARATSRRSTRPTSG